MIDRLIPISAISLLMLVACAETPSDTAKDVAEARQDAAAEVTEVRQAANQDVAEANAQVATAKKAYTAFDKDARKQLTAAEAVAMVTTARAAFDIASAEAEGRHEVAKQRCDALAGMARDACLGSAIASLSADLTLATANRDTALVAAEYHD
jgi:hypothetical protein